jgi:hypothetical protein
MKFVKIILVLLFASGSQPIIACEDNFENIFLNLTICKKANWTYKFQRPYVKIKSPNLKSFITIYGEVYTGSESPEDLLKESFQMDKQSDSSLVLVTESKLQLDSVSGTIYTTLSKDKGHTTSTFVAINEDFKYTFNINCYSNCDSAEQAVRELVENTVFKKATTLKITKKENKALEKFKDEFVSAFKNEDSLAFKGLVQTKEVVQNLLENKVDDEAYKKRMLFIIDKNWEMFAQKFIGKSEESFRRLIADGKSRGVKWNKIKLISFTHKLRSEVPGAVGARCKFQFKSGDKVYQISIKQIEAVEGKWYIFDFHDYDLYEVK